MKKFKITTVLVVLGLIIAISLNAQPSTITVEKYEVPNNFKVEEISKCEITFIEQVQSYFMRLDFIKIFMTKDELIPGTTYTIPKTVKKKEKVNKPTRRTESFGDPIS